MSRHFSSTARAAKKLAWTLRGTTTQHAHEAVEAVDTVLDALPELAAKVNKGVIYGDAHPTPHLDGTVDEKHFSGAVGTGDMKGSKRVTSFHYYPRTGFCKFSNPKYPPVYVASSSTQGGQSSAQAAQPAVEESGSGDTGQNPETEKVESSNN